MLLVLIYSLIQGFTEFLPVSSSGHLNLFNNYYPIEYITQLSMLELNIVSHSGSLLAVLLYYHKWIFSFLLATKFLDRPDIDRNAHLMRNLFISITPIVMVGYLIGYQLYDLNQNLLFLIIGTTSILFGIILFLTDNFCMRIRNLDSLRFGSALLIGLFQCFAIIPGVSRSGSILTSMRFMGFNRDFSVFYSNLLSIPVILGSLILLITKNYEDILTFNYFNLYSILIFIFSFIFSSIFIHFFVSWVRKSSLLIFAIYRVLFGLAIIYLFS